ncbi:MAG: beta-ketoacyl-[acyl-carrier-protein] synthase family protein [bacterium]
MSEKVYITGIGIISAIGNNVREVEESLLAERTGIGEITLFPTVHKGKLPLAEVRLSSAALLGYTGLSGKSVVTRTALLGMIAASEAMISSGYKSGDSSRTALLSATTVGGMDLSEEFFQDYLKDPSKGRLRKVVNHDCGESTERIASFTGINGFVTTISTACSSSANSLMLGARLIKSGMADRVLAGGTDSVTRFTLNGFNTLMILDKNGCRPFDENRAGLTIGEGAAYLMLESEEMVKRSGKPVLAILSGYGNANDAFHQTASSPEGKGAILAMEKAFEVSGLSPTDISYINVHGTGTQNNDLSEGLAIEKVFGSKVPPFSSTKGYTGHTLGAAGAIEAVISILSMKNNVIFPNLNWNTPMKELSMTPVIRIKRDVTVNHVLSNSFGFGGNNSTLILSKVR